MTAAYDAIVLGLGAMGTAAAHELARRGRRVLGLEQFALGHNRGSSHGRTRVIRTAYYEHPDYVPLCQRAFERWYDLEQATGQRLLTECGCLSVGPPGGELVAGVLRAAAEHGLPVERLGPDELRRRYPPFRFGDGFEAVLEHAAGFLAVEACVRAQAAEAVRHGADLREAEPALAWRADGGGVVVETPAGRYPAERLVVTAGPWAGEVLAGLGVPLTVMRQAQLWFGTADDRAFRRDRFPVYMADTPAGCYYGLPVTDAHGHKASRHYGAPELPGPAAIERRLAADDETAVRAFLSQHLPAAAGPLRHGAVCIYTLTPDRHFVIDVHPEWPQVVLAAGFSGHGFKFAPVVGEALADLAETRRTALPVGLFSARRFGA